MNGLPRLRIELEGVRENVAHLFAQNHGALLDMVSETLAQTLTLEWVQAQINLAVDNCVSKAISDVSDNYELRKVITDMVAEQVIKLLANRKT